MSRRLLLPRVLLGLGAAIFGFVLLPLTLWSGLAPLFGAGSAAAAAMSLGALAALVGRCSPRTIAGLTTSATLGAACWGAWILDCGLSCRQDVCICAEGQIESGFTSACDAPARACNAMCATRGGGFKVDRRDERKVVDEMYRRLGVQAAARRSVQPGTVPNTCRGP